MASDDVVIKIRTEDDTKKGIKSAEKSFKGLSSTVTKLAAAGFGLVAIKNFGEAMLDANVEAQKLNASLVSVTGSQEAASRAFKNLSDFATKTPFQLNQVVQAFIKMKSLGLDATEEALMSYGNTASAMGKDLNQMIEAVADATTGEFERLKEFGIKSKSEGDKVSFTFQGVTTTVKKNAEEISGFLKSIGEEKFGDAMSEQMKTLGGAMSNAEDAWRKFLVALGESGIADATAAALGVVTIALNQFSEAIDPTLASRIKDIRNELILLEEQQEGVNAFGPGNIFEARINELSAELDLLTNQVISEKKLAAEEAKATGGKTPAEAAKDEAQKLLQVQIDAGIAASIQQQAIDDRHSEQLQMLMAANKEQYDLDVVAAKEAADQKAANDQLARDTAMTALANLGSLMNTESRKAFEVGKAASIASTLIKTYEGAQNAFTSGSKINVVFGVAAAAAAVAAGLANVQAIQSTQFQGGGGGSPAVPNISPSGIGPQSQTVAQPVATVGELTGGADIEVRTGSVLGVFIEEELIPAMNEANRRGVKLLVT